MHEVYRTRGCPPFAAPERSSPCRRRWGWLCASIAGDSA